MLEYFNKASKAGAQFVDLSNPLVASVERYDREVSHSHPTLRKYGQYN